MPPNTSSGSGKAEAAFDTDTKVLTYTVTYANLTGSALGAHFHGPGEAGKNAGIVLPFKSAQSPIQGTAPLTEAQAARRQMACERPHRGQSGWRAARADDEIGCQVYPRITAAM